MLKFSTTQTFDKQCIRLDNKIQNIFEKKLEYLLQDIKHPSLHTEKINHDLYFFRVNKNFCVIFKYNNPQEIELVFIANHDIYKKIKNF